MTRGPSPEERRAQAAAALVELDALPTDPISVRIPMAVRLTGIGRSTLIPYRCLKKLVHG